MAKYTGLTEKLKNSDLCDSKQNKECRPYPQQGMVGMSAAAGMPPRLQT